MICICKDSIADLLQSDETDEVEVETSLSEMAHYIRWVVSFAWNKGAPASFDSEWNVSLLQLCHATVKELSKSLPRKSPFEPLHAFLEMASPKMDRVFNDLVYK